MDPLTLSFLTGAGYAILRPFLDTLGRQLGGRCIPDGYVRSQFAGLELRQVELRSQEQRFARQIAETRRLRFAELQISLENQRIIQDDSFRLRQWPLPVLPMDIIRRSQASNGRALNVIFKIAGPSRDLSGEETKHTFNILNSGIFNIIQRFKILFGNELLFYTDIVHNDRIFGDNLQTALWSFLRTEPVVLIELSAPSRDCFTLQMSHWGTSLNLDTPPQLLGIMDLNANAAGQNIKQKAEAFATALSAVVVIVCDSFRAISFSSELPTPVFPVFLRHAIGSMERQSWQPLVESFVQLYDIVAKQDSMVASESAARAALVAHGAGEADLAVALLGKSILLHPCIPRPFPDKEKLATILQQLKVDGEVSGLEKALVAVRGWESPTQPSSSSEPEFLAFARNLNMC